MSFDQWVEVISFILAIIGAAFCGYRLTELILNVFFKKRLRIKFTDDFGVTHETLVHYKRGDDLDLIIKEIQEGKRVI